MGRMYICPNSGCLSPQGIVVLHGARPRGGISMPLALLTTLRPGSNAEAAVCGTASLLDFVVWPRALSSFAHGPVAQTDRAAVS